MYLTIKIENKITHC